MMIVIYFMIAILATTVGALTGMGGGVIIKPVLDMIGGYDVATIGVLSSITVFAMSIVSIGRKFMAKVEFPVKLSLYLSIGSVVGGLVGQYGLDAIIESLGTSQQVTVVQNILLAILILGVYLYMKNKSKIKSLELKGFFPAVIAGFFLGCISSFLGIGGGPINVALLIYLFSLNTKDATVCSLMTILFAQISKLASVALATGFGVFDLAMLPAMVIGGVAGGLIGAALNKKFEEKTVEFWFNIVQMVVLAISVYNIIVNVIA